MPIERTEVASKLSNIFKRVFNDQTIVITDNLNANDVAQWDSLTHMLLITEVEKEFGFKFKLKDLTKMRNVGDMMDIIITKV